MQRARGRVEQETEFTTRGGPQSGSCSAGGVFSFAGPLHFPQKSATTQPEGLQAVALLVRFTCGWWRKGEGEGVEVAAAGVHCFLVHGDAMAPTTPDPTKAPVPKDDKATMDVADDDDEEEEEVRVFVCAIVPPAQFAIRRWAPC